MARERVVRQRDGHLVQYAADRFDLLTAKRAAAEPFLRSLPPRSRVFGSVARGDVRPASDVDIEVPFGSTSFTVEVALASLGTPPSRRALVQATPNSVVKALWEFGEVTVSLPLTRPSPLEESFGSFAGALDIAGVDAGARTPGIDKRLMLVEPTPDGHLERSVADRIEECARILRIDGDVIRGRVRVLDRRAKTGRTGVFLTRAVGDDESPESALARISASSPAVRRAVGGRP